MLCLETSRIHSPVMKGKKCLRYTSICVDMLILMLSRVFGEYKNEIEDGLELLTFTSTGPKSYFCEIGEASIQGEEFKTKVTGTIARSKGFTLKHQNTKGLFTKNIMREFLEAVGRNEERSVSIPQKRFEISKNTYTIAPKHYEKMLKNTGILLKRLYNPKVSISKTFPIGAVSFYD